MPRRWLLLGLLMMAGVIVALPRLLLTEAPAAAAVSLPVPPAPVATVPIPPTIPADNGSLTLSNPRASLRADHQGLEAELDISIERAGQTLHGSLSVSGGIRSDPLTQRFFLARPVLKKLDVAGLSRAENGFIQTSLPTALERYFSENPVYNPAGPLASASLRIPLKS